MLFIGNEDAGFIGIEDAGFMVLRMLHSGGDELLYFKYFSVSTLLNFSVPRFNCLNTCKNTLLKV